MDRGYVPGLMLLLLPGPAAAEILRAPLISDAANHHAQLAVTGAALLILAVAVIVMGLALVRRRRAEEALRRSEVSYRTLARNIPAIVYRAFPGEGGRMVFFNDVLTAMTGYAYEELEGGDVCSMAPMILPEDIEGVRRRVRDAVSRNEPFSLSYRFRHKDGSIRHFREIGRPLHGPDRTTSSIDGIILDVTDYVRIKESLEDALAKAEAERARSEGILAALGDGISIHDREFRILFQNAIHKGMVGDHAGERCYESFGGNNGVCDGCPVVRVLETGAVTAAEKVLRTSAGHRHFEITASPIRGSGNEITAVVEIVRDVTDRWNADEERRKLEALLLKAWKRDSLAMLAGGIAHDFNNLLTGVLGNIVLAMEDLPPGSLQWERLRRVEDAARRAAGLTKQMLACAGLTTFDFQTVDLSAEIRAMAGLMEASVGNGALLRFRLEAGLPPVEADVCQLRHAVLNLVSNASESLCDGGGVITVADGVLTLGAAEDSAEDPEGIGVEGELKRGLYVYVEVSDTGCGMTEEVRARIFDPFFTTKFVGRGLGLAAVMGIARGHRGTVTVSSKRGRGSVFRVLFPVCDEAAETSTGP